MGPQVIVMVFTKPSGRMADFMSQPFYMVGEKRCSELDLLFSIPKESHSSVQSLLNIQ